MKRTEISDGIVRMFGGAYLAVYDTDVFESDYLRIEGIRDGDLTVIIRKDQI